MSLESTQAVMMQYLQSEHSDVSMMADDVVFTVMATGRESYGPEGVLQLLTYFYHIAFDATAITSNIIIGDGKAVFEGDFTGKHIGEFAGIPATGKTVHVPLAVIYDLANEKIQRARIYFEMPVLFQQLGAGMAEPAVEQR
jgi:steroid delta-isomerase-like uncharacterized protein